MNEKRWLVQESVICCHALFAQIHATSPPTCLTLIKFVIEGFTHTIHLTNSFMTNSRETIVFAALGDCGAWCRKWIVTCMCQGYIPYSEFIHEADSCDRCANLVKAREHSASSREWVLYPSAPSIDAIFPFPKAARTSFGEMAYPNCSQHDSNKIIHRLNIIQSTV